MVPAGETASLKIWRSEVVETTLFLSIDARDFWKYSPGYLLRGALGVRDLEIERPELSGLPHIPKGARLL
jgi:hypothetical protein